MKMEKFLSYLLPIVLQSVLWLEGPPEFGGPVSVHHLHLRKSGQGHYYNVLWTIYLFRYSTINFFPTELREHWVALVFVHLTSPITTLNIYMV